MREAARPAWVPPPNNKLPSYTSSGGRVLKRTIIPAPTKEGRTPTAYLERTLVLNPKNHPYQKKKKKKKVSASSY